MKINMLKLVSSENQIVVKGLIENSKLAFSLRVFPSIFTAVVAEIRLLPL